MTDASESEDSVWDGEVQEYKMPKTSFTKRSSSGCKTPLHQSTSGWEDDVQEYTRVKTNSSIVLTKMTRDETSGWEDDVQEYGQSLSPLPNVPGQGEFHISPISETALLGND